MELVAALESSDNTWNKRGPANKRYMNTTLYRLTLFAWIQHVENEASFLTRHSIFNLISETMRF